MTVVVPIRSERSSSNLLNLIQYRRWDDIIEALSNGASPHILVLPEMTFFEAYLRHLAKPDLFKVPPHSNENAAQGLVFQHFVSSWRGNDPKYSTPLTLTTMMGRPDLVQALLEAGHDPNEVGAGHQPATILASPLDFDTPESIITDLRHSPELGWSQEVRPGQQSCLRLLLQSGLDIEAKTWNSINALTLACLAKNFSVVTDLLDAGADPEGKASSTAVSPLEIAISGHSEKITTALLSYGANLLRPWIQEPHTSHTIASVACAVGLTSQIFAISKQLGGIDHPAMIQGWWLALSSGNTRNVEWFIDKGQDVKRVDEKGSTALHVAVRSGNRKIIDRLASLGLDFGAEDDNGVSCRELFRQHHPSLAHEVLGSRVGEPGNVIAFRFPKIG